MNPDKIIKVASCPLAIVWADIGQNLSSVGRIVDTLPDDVDILVLPELFSTGFIQDVDLLREVAPKSWTLSLSAVRTWASRRNMAIAGSMLAGSEGKYYNRAFFVEPSGKATFYDKRHLFSLSAESEVYSPGKELPPVISYLGWNISMIVCYDLRFPVWCRNEGLHYDILLVPANWASARGYAFRHLLIARAIENQAFVVGCNRGGSDDYGDYDNQSFIFNPFGYELAPSDLSATKGVPACESLAEKLPDSRQVLFARFAWTDLQRVRSYLPVGRDADRFVINV